MTHARPALQPPLEQRHPSAPSGHTSQRPATQLAPCRQEFPSHEQPTVPAVQNSQTPVTQRPPRSHSPEAHKQPTAPSWQRPASVHDALNDARPTMARNQRTSGFIGAP